MSVSVTKGHEVTIFTVTSKPGSKWPLFCQILGTLCYSPVLCSVSQGLKNLLSSTQSTLGTLQIMVGLINIGVGAIVANVNQSFISWNGSPYWLGGTFIAVGIVCILVDRCPSPCLVVIGVGINLIGAALAVTGIVLYSVDLGEGFHTYVSCTYNDYYGHRDYGYRTTLSPDMVQKMKDQVKNNEDKCKHAEHVVAMVVGALDVLLIVFVTLQLCVTISASVLGIKALYKNSKKENKAHQDPELFKPLLETP